jgi:hypothetical protein
MAEVFRAQVAIDRFAVNNWVDTASGKDGDFRQVSGLRDHAETRAWAVLGTLESAAKTVVAAVAVVVVAIASTVFKSCGANLDIYKDVTATQYNSFWRCALAIYSPEKAMASTRDESKAWLIAKETPKWGTDYNEQTTTLVEKCKVWSLPPVADPVVVK